MTWKIEYFNNGVLDDIRALPVDLRARYARLSGLMKDNGANIGGNQTKHIRNGLFELRLRGKSGIARIMFCTIIDNRIVMLSCFTKKTQKTPQREIDKAIKRLKEVKQ
jgi:phage-related protein